MFVVLSIVHAAALVTMATIPVVAIGLWWDANTIAHNFIHRPFFRTRRQNDAYSIFLSLLLGLPQSLWAARHLAHHAGRPVPRFPDRSRRRLAAVEAAAVATLWVALAVAAPAFFWRVYLPGWAIGLGLCFLQGHYEHVRGTATSHYGRLYNFLFFNDGYHVEHHRRPGVAWRDLPALAQPGHPRSRWPAVLRWLDVDGLEALERLVLRWPWLQRRVVALHERAFRALMPSLPPIRRVTIVGGGLFPRTALVLQRILPDAALTIVDANEANLATARQWLGSAATFAHATFAAGRPAAADLVVVPLAFFGDRRALYELPPAPTVIVHDWIWSRRGEGVAVSWWLLKRLNVVRAEHREAGAA